MNNNVFVTAIGVVTPIGIGVTDFTAGLKQGNSNFTYLEKKWNEKTMSYPMAIVQDFQFLKEVNALDLPDDLKNKVKRIRNLTKSEKFGLLTVLEAWSQLNIESIDLSKVAIVLCGSNTQMDHILGVHEQYREKLTFMNPNYGLSLFDTDLIGVISELLQIKGEGFSVGSASASGNMGVIQATRLIRSGEFDQVVVVAPLMDLSIFELQGFTSIGAMALCSDSIGPTEICRPFDSEPNGFVYGQMAGSLILESENSMKQTNNKAIASVAGYGSSLDSNRNPNPSVEGEMIVMGKALSMAGLESKAINYINAHGTASKIGDLTESEAIVKMSLRNASVNSTKSLIGHGLTAAGLVESIATLIQMKEGFVHVSKNISQPITEEINWVTQKNEKKLNHTMNNSFGFGGINTSIIYSNL